MLHGVDDRLRELAGQGLLEREDYREPGQRTRQRYRLTDKGADLLPALVALMQGGDRWLDDRGGPVELRHRDCGRPVGVELRCGAGHRPGPATSTSPGAADAESSAAPAIDTWSRRKRQPAEPGVGPACTEGRPRRAWRGRPSAASRSAERPDRP